MQMAFGIIVFVSISILPDSYLWHCLHENMPSGLLFQKPGDIFQ